MTPALASSGEYSLEDAMENDAPSFPFPSEATFLAKTVSSSLYPVGHYL